jgi:hypothetical protein
MQNNDKVDTKKGHAKRLLIEALEKHLGIVTQACRAVNVSRETFYKYCREDPEFQSKVEAIRELTLDFVESKLLTQIEAGNVTAAIFYLKTQGKRRGYVETTEIITGERSNVPSWFTDESFDSE